MHLRICRFPYLERVCETLGLQGDGGPSSRQSHATDLLLKHVGSTAQARVQKNVKKYRGFPEKYLKM